ncbi:hypothetical protein IBL99_002937 [Listeria monocytogenes]|nr:hypothetical protein [Listeria monocytogenes]EGE9351490.1 hypothetical protein [Listeria monocytogenes]
MRKLVDYAFKYELIELYLENPNEYENESFFWGYITHDLNDFFVFQSITKTGTLDSIQIIRKKSIIHIEKETRDTKMYKFFIAYNKTRKSFDTFNLELIYALYEEKSFNGILNVCLKYKSIITVNTGEKIWTGRIVLLDEKTIVLSVPHFVTEDVVEKELLMLSEIISISVLSAENFLLSNFLNYNK